MKKKGFTLIELLAVIVILAIIALIAVPVIMNIISKARESAFKDTMYGIVKAGELYYAEELLTEEGMTEDVTFTFSEDGVSPSGLNIKGSLPTSGTMTVTKDGKIILNATDGVYTATKEEDNEEIIVVKSGKVDGPSNEPLSGTLGYLVRINDFAASIDACATAGKTCVPGTPFAIEVAPGDIKNFYVVSDINNVVTLIMDRNIIESVFWATQENNALGPIEALNYLESQTNGWTNIAAKTYTVQDENEPALYTDIVRENARARMIKYNEVKDLINTNSWLYDNLIPYDDWSGNNYGYWTSSAVVGTTSDAWAVGYGGMTRDAVAYAATFGVRPVIELSK